MPADNLEDIYELSPLQQGLLFHNLYAPTSGEYIEQLSITLSGDIDLSALKWAWEQVMLRHPALRTGFFWEGLEKPQQVVYRDVVLPWQENDWRALSGEEQTAQMATYLSEDRERGFDVAQAPLMRFTIVRTADQTYRFVWCFHHLILDGWSTGVVLKEVSNFYRMRTQGITSEATEARPYRDYISWIQQQDLAAAERFWRKSLSGFTKATSLSIDTNVTRPVASSDNIELSNKAGQADQYGRQYYFFSAETTADVIAFARQHQLTMNTLVQAAFALLLSRYSGERDIVFGATSSGRPSELRGVEQMVGLFVNTLPVRVRVDETLPVREWLHKLQRHQADVRQYEYSPLVDVQGWSEIPRGEQLFECLLGYQNYPIRLDESLWNLDGNLEVSDVGALEMVSFPLCVLVAPGEVLGAAIYHDCRRLDVATVMRMAEQFEMLLKVIVGHPEQTLRELPLLTPEQEERMVVEWNQTATSYPKDKSIHQLFEVQAETTPEAVAIQFGEKLLSYREVNEKANKIASYLRSLGVKHETPVGISLERSAELIIAIIGILKAGGAYVPLDSTYPPQRLAFMVEDAQLQLLLTEEKFVDSFSESNAQVVVLERQWAVIERESGSNPPCISGPQSLAYIMYTSGSTGVPKGICIEQRAINRLVLDTDYVSLTAADKIAQASNVSFDAATFEIWGALLNGATLVIVSKDALLSPHDLAREIEQKQINTLFLTTAVFNQISREAPTAFRPLRQLLFGGEAVDPRLVSRVLEQGAPSRLLHVYGPTETTTFATWHLVQKVDEGATTVPIGRPLANGQTYVLNERQQPVPIGVVGELYIGGDGVARGYHNRRELTAERFIPDRFREVEGAFLYRTGDLVRYLADGNIEFVGRVDHQVKLRGFRIELGEIEAVLARYPGVAESAVVIREDIPGDKRIVAYVVADTTDSTAEQTEVEPSIVQQVEEWKLFYDDLYKNDSPSLDQTFNIVGWNSNYTGQALPEDEMRSWLDDTVDRIVSFNPGRTLEIGCGTGLLLFRVAPYASQYHGADFSGVVLNSVRRQIEKAGANLAHVTLSQRTADDFTGIEPGSFDTVILNSVTQYFPNIEYLVRVLEGAVKAVAPGGRIFLGDVRSYPLLEAFHASVQFFKADDGTTLAELKRRVQQELARESELTIDPNFFTALKRHLPDITHVEVLPKRGSALNELTQFRYQVVLRVGDSAGASNHSRCLNWRELGLTLPAVREILASETPDALNVTNIPNARVSRDLALVSSLRTEPGSRTVGDLRSELESLDSSGSVGPDELWELEREFPYDVTVSWLRQHADGGGFDVSLRRKDKAESQVAAEKKDVAKITTPSSNGSWTLYANKPLRAKLSRQLVPELRAFLQRELPEYMVPSAFVTMAELPLTPNGKIDRRGLPAPDESRPELGSEYLAPTTPVEEVLAGIWSHVLGLEQVGIADNFFELGGHSLLATQVVSRVREGFQIELPLRAIFEAPTVAELARRIEQVRHADNETSLPPITRRSRESAPPLSWAQQRLWVLDQLDPTSTVYNTLLPIEFAGTLNPSALEDSLNEIVRRHESLRTTFPVVAGEPIQLIAPSLKLPLPVLDLSALPESDRSKELVALATTFLQLRFDLSTGPLTRVELVKLEADRHILLVSMHHSITDGWSMGLFMRELAAIYETCLTHDESSLPELEIQYADYSEWQREYLEGDVLQRQITYWRKQLTGAPTALELPTDRPRPAVETFRGNIQSVHFSPELRDQLKKLSREEGVTFFMTLLAAFQVLLVRYTSQTDVVVGSAIANRNREQIEKLIGFFVNTLVLRTDLSGNPSFSELLARVREVTLAAYANQDVPFERLVEELHPVRDLSRNPLFQVMFNLQNVPAQSFEINGQRLTMIEIESKVSKFDLTLSLIETEQGLEGGVEYNTDLFDADTITRMVGHYQTLLEAIVEDREQPLLELPLLSGAERREILRDWNDTAVRYPLEHCLHERFEAQVKISPYAVAVVFEDQEVTYAELNERANQLAHYLREQGVGPEVLVGVLAERSVEIVVALLGILKAGGAYVPLDPGYPAERLQFMLADANVRVLLTQEKFAGSFAVSEAAVVSLDSGWARIAEYGRENVASGVVPDNLAYVIYTSGSTGKPKGAMNTHRAICNRLLWMQDAYQLSQADRVLQKTPFSFDVSVWEFFWPLLNGARLIVASPGGHQDTKYLVDLIAEKDITTLHFVPSMLQSFLQEESLEKCSSLRRVICSGEALSFELQQKFFARLPVELHNLYGPTEAAIDVTYWACERESPRRVVPIGRPIANIQIYILDQQLQPVPVGVSGELHIGGIGLARGYWNSPELTAEKFIANPFSTESGARLYKTGDLARYLPDGAIEYLGRMDHQVKLRGFRIELGEIETALAEHALVAEVAVIAREDVPGDQRLVAYIVSANGTELNPAELREHLKRRLPDYMVPAVFVSLENLPLTPNGKIDRKALPAPDHARYDTSRPYVAPRTAVEEILVGVWREVLRLDRVGVEDNFFEIGGHSLLATQVISRLRSAFHLELPLRALFEEPTIESLGRRIEKILETGGRDSVAPASIVRAERNGHLELSFAQQRLWFLDQLEPNSSRYNIVGAGRLTGELNVDALRHSFSEIIRRHEALRTTFTTIDGEPVQIINEVCEVELSLIDLSTVEAEKLGTEIQSHLNLEATRPFSLEHGPLVRASLLRAKADEHILLLAMHHIVSDGWSVDVLRRELVALYKSYCDDTAPEVAELKIQYADFAKWQRDWLQGEVLTRQLDYWRDQLHAPLPVLDLPTDHPRPPVQTTNGSLFRVSLPVSLAEAVKELSRREGVTVYMTLLAAFQTLLSRYSGQEDIVVGSAVAGRNRAETEPLIGYFVNTLVLRTDLSGEPTFKEVLRRVREVALGAYTHQDLPFERLVDELKLERDLSRTPLFQVMFDLQNASAEVFEFEGLKLSPVEFELNSAKFDLSWMMIDQPDGLWCQLEYNTDLFDLSTIERMVRHFQVLLEAAVANAETPIAELPVLTGTERNTMLQSWNDTAISYDSKRAVHQLFEEQVRLAPDAVAVVCGANEVSYRELNERANRLAHRLVRLGAEQNGLVAVMLERSIELVVAVLGTLKAGAAYVPLDPEYPADRLAFMVADAGAAVLLTEESMADRVPAGSVEVVFLDRDWRELSEEKPDDLDLQVLPRDLAYMIYTSGSTGTPKGVEIEHGGLLNLVSWHRRAYDVTASDRATLVASPSFDASVWELWPYLTSGASIHIPDEDTRMSAPRLLSWLATNNITISFLPTPLAESVLLEQIPRGISLRTLLTGGDRLHRVAQRPLPFKLVNHYGPTENTVVATCSDVDPMSQNDADPPIGRPIANVQTYLLNESMQPVPVGVAGEIYVGGASLARGYHNRPELTSQRFVPNPFSDEAGSRLYRTGDLGRYLPTGEIEYLSRTDHQVKIRGFRIELGEIEAVLGRHPAVRENIVVAREDEPGVRRLVAYFVAADDQQPTSSELRSYLKDSLPPHMLPSAFVRLEQLPQTANGKVDRNALPAPEHTRADLDDACVAPRTPTEATLADIWARVLKLDKVGINDNFFELGGDSILSIQIVARAQQAGLKFSPKQLFQNQTVAQLALVAEVANGNQSAQEVVTGPVPLTPVQHWFFEQDLADPHHFNQALVLEVPNSLDVEVLKQSLQLLITHHDALRLRFNHVESGWQQENAETEDTVPFALIDLSSLKSDEQQREFEQASFELQSSLKLATGPIIATALFKLGDNEPGRLLIVVHHLAVDGVSWQILVEDLERAYQQLLQNQTASLPPKTTSFKAWSERLSAYAQSSAMQDEADFWLSVSSKDCATLPLDFVAGENNVASTEVATVALDVETTRALLQEVPSVYHTQINDVLLTALSEALRKWTRGTSLLMDLEGHGREEILEGVDVSRTVGWFTTITPVVLEVTSNFEPGLALQSIKEQLRRIPNRGIGYGLLRYLGSESFKDRLQTDRQAEISFNYLGQFAPATPGSSLFEAAKESSGSLYSPRNKRRHLIELNSSVVDRQLNVAFTYSINLHRAETIERLAQDFVESLRAIIEHCQSSEAGGFTASDFLAAKMSQEDFTSLISKLNKSVDSQN